MMAIRKNSLARLELEVTARRKKAVKDHQYDGLDLHTCIVSQVDLASTRPHKLYKIIKAAQTARVETLDDEFALLGDDMVTLTVYEKNFIQVYKKDVRAGVLRQTAFETFERIDELLREQAKDAD